MDSRDWLVRLLAKWRVDVSTRQVWMNLYDSIHPRLDPVPRYRDAYRQILRMSRSPWARMVVDLTSERLKVQGFRLGADDETDELWSQFRRNQMEAMQASVHREALSTGTGYVSTWPEPADPSIPRMRAESALEVTHEIVPGDPHSVAAAVKVWVDTIEGLGRATVYLPDRIARFAVPISKDPQTSLNPSSIAVEANWDLMEEVGHDYGMVTMTPFATRPDWRGYGRSDLADLSEIISRIEYLTSNTLLAVELGALRQKWATGLEIPTDDDGNPIEPFKVALDRLWVSEDSETKFGSFPATDISPYLRAISDAIGQLSAVSRIPPTYFVQTDLANPPSAASLEASETGLIAKVRDHQFRYGEGWERVAQLSTAVSTGSIPATYLTDLTVLWVDPRTRSDAQKADAALKMQQVGVPWKSLMEFLGYQPTEIARMEADRSADVFNRLLESSLSFAGAPGIVPNALPGTPPSGTPPVAPELNGG